MMPAERMGHAVFGPDNKHTGEAAAAGRAATGEMRGGTTATVRE